MITFIGTDAVLRLIIAPLIGLGFFTLKVIMIGFVGGWIFKNYIVPSIKQNENNDIK